MVDLPHAIVLFDGVCNLCNGAVQFVIRRDRAAYFRYASLQSEVGQSLLKQHGLTASTLTTMVLVEGDTVSVRSTAALRIAAHLTLPWRALARLGWLMPVSWRDTLYRWVARNRYSWFGRREQCWVPTPQLKALFLD